MVNACQNCRSFAKRNALVTTAIALTVSVLQGAYGTPAFAQSGDTAPGSQPLPFSASQRASGDTEDTIIVTGTRETGRKAIDSPTSIAVIGADALAATGQTNVLDALKDVLPAISSQFLISVPFRSFSLRGLGPGETLILVNGKRRHVSGQLFKSSSPYQGSDPVDLDMIPLAAIDHIEFLRDGAAAQYGTDAIAGVLNIILKHNDNGGTASVGGGHHKCGRRGNRRARCR